MAKGFKPKISGRGGKKNKKPKEQADSGRSVSYAQMLGIVSEGEIEGLVDGAQGIYFDETPAQNSDGSSNFTNFSWDWRSGTQAQDRIPGFSDEISSETNVGTEVKQPIPVTRTITNANLDIIRVRLGVVLQEYPPKGGVLGLKIQFRVYVKEGAGAFVLRLDQTIKGRYSSLTEFEYNFPVNNLGGTVNNFSVRVERVTPQDSDTTRYQRVLQWRTLIEVTEAKLRYPNSALFGFRFDAAQFESLPQISLKLAGRKIAIPTNATPTATRGLTYSGIWDGTFYVPSVAIADPAWILYDLITNTRYGLGRYINQDQIDKWALYEISQYCNEYVPNGEGGTEHRFQCHVLLEGKEEAYKVIESIRSIFRGFSYWMNGAISFAADKPASPVAQFTQADIENGMFSYSRTGLKSRHTIALVTWLDPDDFYRQTIETVEDSEGIAKYGVRELEMSAFACTSKGQARRAGLAALLTERLETETVTFRVRAYGAYTKPGDIIRISDAKRADIRYGGLIADSTQDSVTLDNPVALDAGEDYTLTIMMADGTVVERTVINPPGSHTTLNLDEPLDEPPPLESNWILASTTVQPQLFRVLNRVPAPGSREMLHEITALEYRSDKYNAIEQGWSLTPRPTINRVPVVVNVPRNIALSYRAVNNGASFTYTLDASWQYPLNNGTRDQFITSYFVEYSKGDGGDWIDTRTVTSTGTQYEGLSSGKYYVRVAAIDINGKSSRWVESSPILLTNINYSAVFTTQQTTIFMSDF
jgi:predicted phage tail protein